MTPHDSTRAHWKRIRLAPPLFLEHLAI